MIDNVSGVSAALMPPSQSSTAGTLPSAPLTESDFMKLMVQQLKDQDPTNPVDPSQFMGQLAQFNEVEATEQMQTSLAQLASTMSAGQAANAAALVGRTVMAPGSTLDLTSSGADGGVDVPAGAGDVRVVVSDTSGNPIRTIDLGEQSAGTALFHWNGEDAGGHALPLGSYRITASAGGNQLATFASGQVTSVGNGSGGITVNVAGIGPVPLAKVTQFF